MVKIGPETGSHISRETEQDRGEVLDEKIHEVSGLEFVQNIVIRKYKDEDGKFKFYIEEDDNEREIVFVVADIDNEEMAEKIFTEINEEVRNRIENNNYDLEPDKIAIEVEDKIA